MFALVPPLFFRPLMIGPLGMQEMLIILMVALIVFGPRKLPQIGKTLGKSIAEFRRTSTELRSTLEREVQMEEFRTARSEVSGLGKEVADLGRGLDPDAGSGPSAAKPPESDEGGAGDSAAKPPQSDEGDAGDSGEPSATREKETQNGTGDSSASGPETGVAEDPEGVAEGASEAGSSERESTDDSGK